MSKPHTLARRETCEKGDGERHAKKSRVRARATTPLTCISFLHPGAKSLPCPIIAVVTHQSSVVALV